MKKISAVTENIVTFQGHNQHLYEERQIRFLKWGIPVPTNSARLFILGEKKALAKSKVVSCMVMVYGWTSDLLIDLKNMTVCQEWDKQYFNFQKHIFGKLFHTRSFKTILLLRNMKN
jgi:hypothetical protein